MQTIIPSDEYKTEFVPGSVKAAISASGATGNDLLMVPIDQLVAPAGFNVRVQNEAREERIEEITDSILANGFFKHMPLKGYAGKEGDISFIYITGGFTRLEAAKRAIKRGAPIERLPVVLAPPGTSMIDLTFGLFTDNTGQPLKPYERGTVVKRLLSFGVELKVIAERMALGVGYINELLYLHSLPSAITQMVISDKVSAGHACHLAHEKGPAEAAKVLAEALAASDEELRDDSPEAAVVDGSGTAGRVTPKRTRTTAAGPSKKIVFAAIDYAIALPGDGIEFLSRWRKGEKDALAEVEATLKKPKAAKKPKKAKAVKKAAKATPKKAKVSPTLDQKTVDAAAAAEITKAADKLAKEAAEVDL